MWTLQRRESDGFVEGLMVVQKSQWLRRVVNGCIKDLIVVEINYSALEIQNSNSAYNFV